MKLTNAQRAGVLIEALPYIQEYTDKVVVVKYGGNAMVSGELKEAVMGDIVLLSLIGVRVVLVHGGGPEITEMLSRVGKKECVCRRTSRNRRREHGDRPAGTGRQDQ